MPLANFMTYFNRRMHTALTQEEYRKQFIMSFNLPYNRQRYYYHLSLPVAQTIPVATPVAAIPAGTPIYRARPMNNAHRARPMNNAHRARPMNNAHRDNSNYGLGLAIQRSLQNARENATRKARENANLRRAINASMHNT
eukprot:2765397-Prymnesium_polylepis.1